MRWIRTVALQAAQVGVAAVAAVVLAGVIALAGCGETGTAPDVLLTGTFTLQTVNGAPLPAVTSRDARSTVEVVANAIHFFENSTYVEFGQIRVTDAAGVTTTLPAVDNGQYTRQGSLLTLVGAGKGTTSAVLTNGDGTLSVKDGDNLLTYRR